MPFAIRLLPLLTVAAAILAGMTSARAHPHVWVTMRSDLIYAPDGRITGIRNHWTFDEGFSTFATQGLETDGKGGFTARALAPLGQVNIESLKEFDYFTYAKADGRKASMRAPLPDYQLTYTNPNLTLNFTLPFKTPVKAKMLRIEIYDPTIFVDFEFAKDEPVKLIGAPIKCKLKAQTAPGISPAQIMTLGEAFFNALTSASSFGEQFANKIEVTCP
jgi:ABC-type uncharacterized transport system substrate-binding protein